MTTPSTEELYLQIIEAKNNFSSLGLLTPNNDEIQQILDDFNGVSQVQPWRIWAWLFAKMSRLNYEAFELHKKEVEDLISAANGINTPWLLLKAKNFEYGNTNLEIPEKGEPFYKPSDPGLRIVTVASVQRIRRVTLLLVAKGEAGAYQKLDDAELSALRSYINEISPPGGVIAVDSREADDLAFDMKLYYKGISKAAIVQPLVEQAIKDFLAQLDFAGYLDIQSFYDAIQKVENVISIELDSIRIRKAGTGNQYVDFTTERGYSSYAGWVKWNEGDSNLTLVGL